MNYDTSYSDLDGDEKIKSEFRKFFGLPKDFDFGKEWAPLARVEGGVIKAFPSPQAMLNFAFYLFGEFQRENDVKMAVERKKMARVFELHERLERIEKFLGF